MSKLKVFPSNSIGRDFVIGDIHGCYDEFISLLEHVNFDKQKDRCFSVGDLIDRGNKSLDCLSLLYQDWFHAVRGNHEQLMIDTIVHRHDSWDWFNNGGSWYIQEDEDLIEQLAYKANALPYVIVIEDICNIVHAELLTNSNLEYVTQNDIFNWNFNAYNEDNMIWSRQLVRGARLHKTEFLPVICGHNTIADVFQYENHTNIDTGAVYGNKLSMLELHGKGEFTTYCYKMETGLIDTRYELNQ